MAVISCFRIDRPEKIKLLNDIGGFEGEETFDRALDRFFGNGVGDESVMFMLTGFG